MAACALFLLNVADPMPFLWERYSPSAVGRRLWKQAAVFCLRHAGEAQ